MYVSKFHQHEPLNREQRKFLIRITAFQVPSILEELRHTIHEPVSIRDSLKTNNSVYYHKPGTA